MGAYILRRLLLIIPTLLGVMIINFTLTQFVPGGPVEQIIAQLAGEATFLKLSPAAVRKRPKTLGVATVIMSGHVACHLNSSPNWKNSLVLTSRRWNGF